MPRARKRPERPSKLDPFKRVILEQLEKNPSYNGELIFERIASMGYVSKNGDAFTESGDQITFSAVSGHYIRYRYDLWNRLASVDKGASAAQVVSYPYDPTSRRIQKTSRSSRTSYVYGIDGNVLRETRDETMLADVTIDYVYALGRLAGWTETTGGVATKYWATSDHLGSVTAATDSGGTLAMRRDFSAFGDSMDAVLETAAGPRYTGKDFDEDAELCYFNARWYDAELGRFTTEDPIKDGTNWYAYVNNRPLNNTDPSGLDDVIATYDKSEGTVTVRYYKSLNDGDFKLTRTFTFNGSSSVRNEFNGRPAPDVHTSPADGSTPQHYYPRVIPDGAWKVSKSIRFKEGTDGHDTFGEVFVPTSAKQDVPVYGVEIPQENPVTQKYESTGTQKDKGYGLHFQKGRTWGCIGVPEQEDAIIYANMSDKALKTPNGSSTLIVQE